MDPSTRTFALPDRLATKAHPDLIADDEQHFAAIARSLADSVADLTHRLDVARHETARHGEAALNRDQEVRRLAIRLRTLLRFGADLCLGRMVTGDGAAPVYLGRLGLSDRDGRRLLIDWRSPAAEPFFGATHADPMGLTSRRRYRWSGGRITDYWDEVFGVDHLDGHAALDDQSAFIASLGASRSERMRDVLGTIAADQDAIVRAGSRGALVVDGGPGTGKTVVALHRTAYLLYADPRLGQHRGRVLFVGPHQPYLSYVADVLPSLGEDGVLTCTLRDLLPEGVDAPDEVDPAVAALKSDARMVAAIGPAVGLYEEAPSEPMLVATAWAEIALSPAEWREAFESPDPGVPHNDARDQVWDELLTILVDKVRDDEDVSPELLRRSLQHNDELVDTFNRSWPLIEPSDLVGDLLSVPAYLRMCAPWLKADAVRLLQRRECPHAWTTSDLPILDAARLRLGDPETSRRRRRAEVAATSERDERAAVVDHLVENDDSEMHLMSMLRVHDLQAALVDDAAVASTDPDVLAGPFAHVVVDEAQELTDAEWQMLLARCPSRSFTIVGDRAQARHGFAGSWAERLGRIGIGAVEERSLSINYRTPEEVMAEAEPVIRAALPDANVPTSVRSSGVPVLHGVVAELDRLLVSWAADDPDGIACVIAPDDAPLSLASAPRVRRLSPLLAKGLEFDLVVLIDPQTWGEGIEGVVDRYVAMTRATQRLVILTSAPESE